MRFLLFFFVFLSAICFANDETRSPEQQKIEFLEQRIQELRVENQKLSTKLDGIDDTIKKTVEEKTAAYDKLNSQSVASFNSLVSLLQVALIIASFLVAVLTWVGWSTLRKWIRDHVQNEAEKQIKNRVSDEFLASKIDGKSQIAMEKLELEFAEKAEELFTRYENELNVRLAEAKKLAEEMEEIRKQTIETPLSPKLQASAERLEAKAEQKLPEERTEDDWFLLGLQAGHKNDHQTAFECFEKVHTSGGLCNAALAAQKMEQFDKAERLFQLAVNADPMSAHALGSYAGFLMDIRKDYARAEPRLLRAIAIDPEDASHKANYAELLFINGRIDEAKQQLTQAEQSYALTDGNKLGLHFCRYVFLINERTFAIEQLKALLQSSARAKSWRFNGIIEFAVEAGDPELDLLQHLARVINGEGSPDDLNQYEAWRTA